MDLKRMIRERKFYLAVLIAFGGILLGAQYPEIKEGSPLESGTFLKVLTSGMVSDTALFLLPAAAALPMAEEYLRERQGNFIRFLLPRRTRREYCLDKIFTTLISGALTWLLACALGLLFFFLLFFGFEEAFVPEEGTVLEVLRILGRECLTASSLSVLGAVCALLGRSAYLALGMPFVMFYTCMILRERYLENLYCIDPSEWVRAENDWGRNQAGLWLLLVLLPTALSLLHGLLLRFRLEEI